MKKIHNIFKPNCYYIILLLILYFISGPMGFPIEVFGNLFPLVVFVISPLLAVIFTVKSIQTNIKKPNLFALFGICVIPGFITGVLIVYDLNAMGHGTISTDLAIFLLIAGLIVGLISGAMGLITNVILKNLQS